MKNKLVYLIVFIAIFFVLDSFIGHVLKTPKRVLIRDKKYDPYWRWKEFYELPKDSIDVLFLGSSHCYRSFDPKIFDGETGIRSMNMGSSAQTPLTSYYVLKEVLETQKPKLLVMEIYWKSFVKDKKHEFTNVTYNFENMRWGPHRIRLFLSGYTLENVLKLCVQSFHYRLGFDNTIRHFMGKNVSWATGDYYNGRGYVLNPNIATFEELNEANQFKGTLLKVDDLKPVYVRYLKKIVELCRSRNIPIVFVTAPLPPTTLGMIGQYEVIHNFFMSIAQSFGIVYMDYNVEPYKLGLDDSYFRDDNHLNVSGVDVFTRDIARRLRELNLIGPPSQ